MVDRGAVLEPYEPSWRDAMRWAVEDLLSGIGASKSTSQRYGDQLVGSPSSHGISAADVVPYLSNALAADEGKRAYDRGDWLGAGLNAVAALPSIPMARVKLPDEALQLRRVDVDAVNRLWQNDPGYFVPPGSGGKLDRAKQFISGLGESDEFVPPTLGVNDAGIGFDDGRHRFAAMRDLGMTEAPVAMDAQSIANAERLGLLSRQNSGSDLLDISPEAGLERAKAGGFFTELPLYHGSGQSFPSFRAADTLRDPMVTPGVSVALNPAVANEFATLGDNARANPQVYKLFHRADRPASLTLTGSESHREVVGALHDAFDSGRDAVMLRNYTTPNGLGGQNIIIVKDPSQLRSVNAAFDPAHRGDADLLAGLGAIGLLGAGSGFLMQDGGKGASQ